MNNIKPINLIGIDNCDRYEVIYANRINILSKYKMFAVHSSYEEVNMLELKNIKWKTPDGDEILKNISLEIEKGKLTVITGPNGSGKTTLAKIIAGLETPTEGQIFLDGEDITDWDITKRAKSGIGYSFQQPVKFKGFTVRDILELSADSNLPDGEICDVLGKVGLCTKDYIDRFLDSGLSGGESKRIEIASVLARKNVRVMVFDEPEAGIDLWSFAGLIDAFLELKKTNDEALLIISHQERILDIADKIVVIDDGNIRTQGEKAIVLPQLLSGEISSVCPLEVDGKEVLV